MKKRWNLFVFTLGFYYPSTMVTEKKQTRNVYSPFMAMLMEKYRLTDKLNYTSQFTFC